MTKPRKSRNAVPEVLTKQEQLVIAEIRLLALQFENLMLVKGKEHGLIPSQDEVIARIPAVAWAAAERKVPFRPSKAKKKHPH